MKTAHAIAAGERKLASHGIPVPRGAGRSEAGRPRKCYNV